MLEFAVSAVAFIVAIALLIAVHEYGHFIVARKLGVRVEKFSVGFGPGLFSWHSRDGEVEYVIAAIPLGGYVKMLGENPDPEQDEMLATLPEAEQARAFARQPVWKRAAIAAAGPLFNFVFAIVVYMAIAWIGQPVTPAVVGHVTAGSLAERAGITTGDRIVAANGQKIHAWQQLEEQLRDAAGDDAMLRIERDTQVMTVNMHIPLPEKDVLLTNMASDVLGFSAGERVFANAIVKDSPAARGGLKKGDEIVQVDNHTVDDARMLVRYIESHAGQPIILGVLRDGLRMNLTVTPHAVGQPAVGRMGVHLAMRSMQQPVIYRMGVAEGISYGFSRSWEMTSLTVEVLAKMVVNAISPSNIGGPIAIAQMAGKTAEVGLVPYLLFLALISINLGVLNLLPVPILDGGHLAYLSLEALRGKPLSPAMMEKTQIVGVLLIAALMVFAFYNDIARFLKG